MSSLEQLLDVFSPVFVQFARVLLVELDLEVSQVTFVGQGGLALVSHRARRLGGCVLYG